MATERLPAHLVDDLQAEQRRRWLSGDRVLIETLVEKHPALATQRQDMIELIVAELRLRRAQGEQPQQAEYVRRFPNLAPWLEALFQPRATLASADDNSTKKDSAAKPAAGNGQSALPPAAGDSTPTAILETAAFDAPQPRPAVDAAFGTSFTGQSGQSDPRATADWGAGPTKVEGVEVGAISDVKLDAVTIGRYEVINRLGAGAFGLVYLAMDPELKREVAIKIPHPHMVADAENYLAEAQNVARLDHPGIVPVFDVGRTPEGHCYVVSKYIRGGGLAGTMKDKRPFEASALLVAEVAEALHHAHQRGLVHRDIKPANILMDDAGRPLVADFGLALKEEEFGKGGTFSGTPAYMSPEQARREGHLVDARSDIYSLGIVLFELLAGRLPYRSHTVSDLINEVSTVETRPPRQLDDTIPEELDQICKRALAKRPSDRYSTALDMAKALRAAVAPLKVRRANRGIWWAVGTPIAALLVAWLINTQQKTAEESQPGQAAGSAAGVRAASTGVAPPLGTVVSGDLELALHCQRMSETSTFEILTPKDPPLANGDKLQIHVTSGEPQYLYVYWYDPAGKSRRLWPDDPTKQSPTKELSIPPERDSWLFIEGSHGNELVIAGSAEKPLNAAALAALEETPSFAAGNRVLTNPLMLPIVASTERGLGAGTVKSSKSPLDSHFEDLLRRDFETYRGIVVPHE